MFGLYNKIRKRADIFRSGKRRKITGACEKTNTGKETGCYDYNITVSGIDQLSGSCLSSGNRG